MAPGPNGADRMPRSAPAVPTEAGRQPPGGSPRQGPIRQLIQSVIQSGIFAGVAFQLMIGYTHRDRALHEQSPVTLFFLKR